MSPRKLRDAWDKNRICSSLHKTETYIYTHICIDTYLHIRHKNVHRSLPLLPLWHASIRIDTYVSVCTPIRPVRSFSLLEYFSAIVNLEKMFENAFAIDGERFAGIKIIPVGRSLLKGISRIAVATRQAKYVTDQSLSWLSVDMSPSTPYPHRRSPTAAPAIIFFNVLRARQSYRSILRKTYARAFSNFIWRVPLTM